MRNMKTEKNQTVIEKTAKMEYEDGIRLLSKQKPREAIYHIKKALELNPHFEEAKQALEDALEALTWNAWHFCKKCGKLILPNSLYPYLTIDGYCPKCGEFAPTFKEEIISIAEIALKIALFGIFPILIFIFCGMPNLQLIPKKMIVEPEWYDLTDGIFMAANLTPIMLLLMLLFNDPELTREINFFLFGKFSDTAYFIAASLFFFVIMYLYFFVLLTPFFTLHKKGMWKSKPHQKQILIYTAIFVGVILILRMSFGVFR